MKHFSAARLAAASIAVAASALPAFADKPPDISGRWKFKTVLESKGCVITGDIQFRKALPPLDYVCTFRSREDCDRKPPGKSRDSRDDASTTSASVAAPCTRCGYRCNKGIS